MKKIILLPTFLLFAFFGNAQMLSPEQEKIVFDLSVQSANMIADQILTTVTDFNGKIKIRVMPANNSDGSTTILGSYFMKFLTNNLQADLDKVLLKKNKYEVIYYENDRKTSVDFNLETSYFIKDNNFTFSEITLNSVSQKISLNPFSVEGELFRLNNLTQITSNIYFNKILSFDNNSNLFKEITIFGSDGKMIPPQQKTYELTTNEQYKFRLNLQKRTFLYVFYYEPQKSSFYILYPIRSNDNRPTTYHLKDIREIKFFDAQTANLKIVVSATKLNFNNVLDNNNQISSKNAEIIYRELLNNKNNISTENYRLKFKNLSNG